MDTTTLIIIAGCGLCCAVSALLIVMRSKRDE